MNDVIVPRSTREASITIQTAVMTPQSPGTLYFAKSAAARDVVTVRMSCIRSHGKLLSSIIVVELPNGETIEPHGAHSAACVVMTVLSLLPSNIIPIDRAPRGKETTHRGTR